MKAGGKAHQDAVAKVQAAINTDLCSVAERRRRQVDQAHTADHPYAVKAERQAAAESTRKLLADVDPHILAKLGDKLGSGQDSGTVHDLHNRVVDTVLQAIAFARHGYAEGSLARHPDGRYARRYYSPTKGRLVWLVNEPPTDTDIAVDWVDEFKDGDGWQVAVIEPWKVVF